MVRRTLDAPEMVGQGARWWRETRLAVRGRVGRDVVARAGLGGWVYLLDGCRGDGAMSVGVMSVGGSGVRGEPV